MWGFFWNNKNILKFIVMMVAQLYEYMSEEYVNYLSQNFKSKLTKFTNKIHLEIRIIC